MVVGTLSCVQKGQTSGCSDTVDTVHSGRSGCSTQWMQYAVDTVRSGIVLYGGGDIVFDTKRSNQWNTGRERLIRTRLIRSST